MDFHILGSSSLGNCALLRTGYSKILIDAGFSGKRIEGLLSELGESIDTIDAVFLTHEHQDHAQGIRGLARRSDLPVYANRDTASAVQEKLSKRANWKIFQTGDGFEYRDLKIESFSIPHDAYDPVGFTFHWGQQNDLLQPPQSLAWVTDLGYVPENVKAHLSEVETLVIESNYDEEMLENDTKRPWSTKQRIRGRHGHLSNKAAYEALDTLRGKGRLKNVILAHLSKDCNSPEKVRSAFAGFMKESISVNIIDPGLSIIPTQIS